ncbi:hypothetical protein KIKIMORA_03140 [Brevundimonas phage vB_BpoS-Kikimora]|uniref:Uncharacterized protein n=1 Tax=Brevundimonas phage vB_BpoS-Kikimora TaxID=2948601 RepID=A0A9E7MTN8_9CAUD|nr:hypothetical protein KIKIMORA_03140 [Brevundimonas phage vB_BpoS-Kikimora]
MTTASKSRIERRKAARSAVTLPDRPTSIISFTEGENGGFTVNMGLHGARMEALDPGKSHPLSIVDVVALALNTLVRGEHPALIEAMSLVSETLRNVNAQIDAGEDVDAAVAAGNEALAGAFADIAEEKAAE